jgi:hypothetical protein
VSARFDIPLDADEGVVLAHRGGGTRGYPIWISLLVLFVVLSTCSMFGWGMLVAVAFTQGQLSSGSTDGTLASLTIFMVQAPCFALSLFLVMLGIAAYALPRSRPYFFFTTHHLVGKRVFGRPLRVPLGQIERMERFVAVTYGRYGTRRETITDELALTLRPGNVPRSLRLGPIDGVDDFLSLFDEARSREHVELEQMARADGSAAPCELRSEFFIAATTRSLGMTYGALFIGPTTVIRFTEALPMGLMGRLYTRLAHAVDGEEAELRVKEIARHSTAGHTLVLDRASARPIVDGRMLEVRAGERTEPIELRASDAERARAFLAR